MKKNRCRDAFTLIEVLIVVIIMAVLAATVIPQFTNSTRDAKLNQMEFNLRTMRSQTEMYKFQHNGVYPETANFTAQMTAASNISGGTSGDTPYGPYLEEVPYNPFNESNEIVEVAAQGTVPTAVVAGGAGWQYDPSTGGVYPNNAEYYE